MKDLDWVDNLTLRLSYGQLGNDSLDSYYAWQSLYDLTYANATNPGAVVASLENQEVSWEKKNSWNAGIEGTFFDRFLNLTAEFYTQTTTDMLLSLPMPTSTGFNGYNSNIGSMRNNGFETTLKFNWVNTKDLKISSTLMTFLNRNKVIALTSDDTITSGNRVIEVGKPIYTFYMPKFGGVDSETGNLLYWAYDVDDNGDKVVDSDYLTDDYSKAASSYYYFDSREPKLQGSFGSDFQWKAFDFSFLTTFSFGGNVYDSLYASSMEVTYDGDTWNRDILKRWQKPGDVTDVPAVIVGADRISTSKFLIDASYFAIKSVQFGYTLPTKVAKAIDMKSLRVFAAGDNICMFSKLQGLNPQYNFSGGTNWSYTPTRTFSLGVDINF